MKRDRAAGVATLDAAGVELNRDVLAKTQSANQPLVRYLETLRWVFITIALDGIAPSTPVSQAGVGWADDRDLLERNHTRHDDALGPDEVALEYIEESVLDLDLPPDNQTE